MRRKKGESVSAASDAEKSSNRINFIIPLTACINVFHPEDV